MDFYLQGPLHRQWGKARPQMGPFNGNNHMNHVFSRGGVDHFYRLEPAAGVHGPAYVWVWWTSKDMTTMKRPEVSMDDVEFLDD